MRLIQLPDVTVADVKVSGAPPYTGLEVTVPNHVAEELVAGEEVELAMSDGMHARGTVWSVAGWPLLAEDGNLVRAVIVSAAEWSLHL